MGAITRWEKSDVSLYLLLALVGFAMLRTLADWRQGLFMMILIAAVQDPLRKLAPGTPGYLVLATAPVMFMMVLLLLANQRSAWLSFQRHHPAPTTWSALLVLASLPAAAISASYGPGSWMLTIFGAFSYAIMFLAIIIGYTYPRRLADIRRLLVFFCLVTSVMLLGTFIEYLGIGADTGLLGTENLGFKWIRYIPGFQIEMISGFYRSPDVMGWHAAAMSMFSVVLAFTTRGRMRWFWLAMSVIGIGALMVCGRRKMAYMLPVFALTIGWIFWQSGRKSQIFALVVVLLVPTVSVIVVSDLLGSGSAYVRYYSDTADESLDRFGEHGFASLAVTYRQNGFFGAGLGVASPGSHHLQVARPRVWQESGSSRLLVELGVPGFAAFVAVMVALLIAGWRQVLRHTQARSSLALYGIGLYAFFIANAGSLMVSGQILADPFIASFLGISIGMVLSLSRVALRERQPLRAGRPVTRSLRSRPLGSGA